MAKDFLRSAITTRLVPVLTAAGFERQAPKIFVRVRGDLVDSLWFNPSRWGGGAFHVQYGIGVASNPFFEPDRPRVGGPLDEPEGVSWSANDEASANSAVDGLVHCLPTTILAWLDE